MSDPAENSSSADSPRNPEGRSEARIAFQGEVGAYSHLACRQVYPELDPYSCPSFADAFAVVSERKARLAMIPIENTTGGRVADIHHLLPESTLHIVNEHFQPIQHCLMGPRGASLSGVKQVESHEQALAQCRHYLRANGFTPIVGADTAGSARAVAERGDPSCAALASRLAADIYNLDVLAEGVEDLAGNTTRFVVLSTEPAIPALGSGPCMTSILFRLRSVPAALYKALGGFATNGVNITKLESYIMDSSFAVAQFYLELEGHPEETGMVNALDELAFFSTETRIMGTYPAHQSRRMNR